MKENFDCGNPEDRERHNSWPTEKLLPGFRHFTEELLSGFENPPFFPPKNTLLSSQIPKLLNGAPTVPKNINRTARSLYISCFSAYL